MSCNHRVCGSRDHSQQTAFSDRTNGRSVIRLCRSTLWLPLLLTLSCFTWFTCENTFGGELERGLRNVLLPNDSFYGAQQGASEAERNGSMKEALAGCHTGTEPWTGFSWMKNADKFLCDPCCFRPELWAVFFLLIKCKAFII